ncbi:alpha-xylosidase [Timonella sp. A28]|uniref:alpha-xylosidase n=1 Tax=Timonella sp. A28 TaxID=3442640 RepID=UPI003EBF421C
MKFSNGYWLVRDGYSILRPRDIDEVVATQDSLTVYAPTAPIQSRGDTLNRPVITTTFTAPAPNVIGVRIEHHKGAKKRGPEFSLAPTAHDVDISVAHKGSGDKAVLQSGDLVAQISTDGPWHVDFVGNGKLLTSSGDRSVGIVQSEEGAKYVYEQLTLGPAENIYGLGERFGAYLKNGQSIDIWNEDGGTQSEQAYKNVPFYVSDAGYGVFVDHPEKVSFEVGSEVVSRTQFSVSGDALQYYVIFGDTLKEVLSNYTALTGRPARVPAWSYGTWLSTSFTTEYDEQTVNHFIDGMIDRQLPLSVFHFDCFWMRGFHWSDFVWHPETFPDPQGMLDRIKAKGLKVCVWINPYIAQRSHLFEEGMDKGYFVTEANGDVWQWDLWQAGMALVDFTNPEASAWYVSKLRALLDMGVDCFKTDFGERIPTDVVWFDQSDPLKMHNYYTHLYNKAVFDLLEEERGVGEAVLFARSATAGGQQFPVHWGGDCESTFVAMAESLRGGLSLALSGFGYWSHDIGGFEGDPDPAVFKRWTAFGFLSSHSRFHGSNSYRVPWLFDEEAVDVTRKFAHLKMSLMPYLGRLGEEAAAQGIPVMRPMVLEFPHDRTARAIGTQYMLGDALLVAPVFHEKTGEFYVPQGVWTSVLNGKVYEGPRWFEEDFAFDELPVLARPNTVIPFGDCIDRPDYDWADGVTLKAFAFEDGACVEVTIPDAQDGSRVAARFTVARVGDEVTAVRTYGDLPFALEVNGRRAQCVSDRACVEAG